MNNKNKHKELLSRRDFFKKAAIKTLPFIAVISLPSILTACSSEPIPTPSGCDDRHGKDPGGEPGGPETHRIL